MNLAENGRYLVVATGAAGAVFLAGIGMSSIAGLVAERDHYRAEAARPLPTVTQTTTETTSLPPSQRASSPARPRPTAAQPQAAATEVAAAQQGPAGAGGADQGLSGAGSGAGGSSSGSTPPATPASCRGSVLAAHLPLGVLPHCALTVGGNR